MGLFGWIKRSLGGGGGIGTKLVAPKSFMWADGELALQVTLSGHKAEPRTVTGLEFRLQDVAPTSNSSTDSSDRSSNGERLDYTWNHAGPIELGPGASVVLEITMPLPFDTDEKAPVALTEGKSILGRLVNNIATTNSGPPTHIRHYLLSAGAEVEGAKLRANANQQLRYGSAWKGTTTIGGLRISD